MSVIDVHEIWEGRDAKEEVGGKTIEGLIRRYTRVFRVQTNDPLDGPQVAIYAECLNKDGSRARIPTICARYRTANSYDQGSRCSKISAKRDRNTRTVWIVACEYSSDSEDVGDPRRELRSGGDKPKEPKGAKDKSDPTAKPPKVTTTAERYVRACVVDLDGKKFATTAGEPFDPPWEVEDLRPVIRITYYKQDFDHRDKINKIGVNNFPFMGVPIGAVRHVPVGATDEWDNGVHYWTVTREFHIDLIDFWHIKALDFGMRVRDLMNGGYKRPDLFHVLRLGLPGGEKAITTPVPLDGFGNMVDDPQAVFVHDFRVYPDIGFGAFDPGGGLR